MRVNRSAHGRGAHATSVAFSTPACGGGGIRTHGELAPTAVFKTAAFDRSATPPIARTLDILSQRHADEAPIDDLIRLVPVAMAAATGTQLEYPEWRYWAGCCRNVR